MEVWSLFTNSISQLPQATLSRGQAPSEFLLWLRARPSKIVNDKHRCLDVGYSCH